VYDTNSRSFLKFLSVEGVPEKNDKLNALCQMAIMRNKRRRTDQGFGEPLARVILRSAC